MEKQSEASNMGGTDPTSGIVSIHYCDTDEQIENCISAKRHAKPEIDASSSSFCNIEGPDVIISLYFPSSITLLLVEVTASSSPRPRPSVSPVLPSEP